MEQLEIRNLIKDHLETGKIGDIYRNTYYSLLDRVLEDGCFPESVGAGGYGGVMFCRTTGATDALFRETGEYKTNEKIIRFALDSARRMNLRRIPHIAHPPVYNGDGSVSQNFSKDDQADGCLHVIGAWAKMVLSGKASKEFEDEYYSDVKMYLDILMNMPYFYYDEVCPSELYPHMFPAESLCLVYNCAFEHSRENRRWSVFDILTQSFAGAALEAMIKVAKKREDFESAKFWEGRLEVLKGGIDKYMTQEIDGKKCYIEMRVPNGGWGRVFKGLGFFNWSPMAAGWEGLDKEVLDNTINHIRKTTWVKAPFTDDLHYMATDYDEDGVINPAILGKGIGWDIVYCIRTGDYKRILDWILFLEEVNTSELLAENLTPTDGKWLISDGGNGEQCAWWCWAIAKLRNELGLKAAPTRK